MTSNENILCYRQSNITNKLPDNINNISFYTYEQLNNILNIEEIQKDLAIKIMNNISIINELLVSDKDPFQILSDLDNIIREYSNDNIELWIRVQHWFINNMIFLCLLNSNKKYDKSLKIWSGFVSWNIDIDNNRFIYWLHNFKDILWVDIRDLKAFFNMLEFFIKSILKTSLGDGVCD